MHGINSPNLRKNRKEDLKAFNFLTFPESIAIPHTEHLAAREPQTGSLFWNSILTRQRCAGEYYFDCKKCVTFAYAALVQQCTDVCLIM